MAHQLDFPQSSLKSFPFKFKVGQIYPPLKYCDPLTVREQTLHARFATPNVDNPTDGVSRERNDNMQSRRGCRRLTTVIRLHPSPLITWGEGNYRAT